MLKGFIVIFTAIISYFIFKRKFTKLQLIGIFFVILGLLFVGSSNIHSYNPKCNIFNNILVAPRPLLGNSLVILGQLFLAGMFVYEEKILTEYDVHVFEIVGWEGVWGLLISSFFIGVFYLIPGNTKFLYFIGHDQGSWENPLQATTQVFNNPVLFLSILCSTLIIGPFNYFGTNLTKYSSAMHRCLIDASRMCVVWLISLCCNWESFKTQQVIGYTFVLIGNLVYYEIIKFDLYTKQKENSIPFDQCEKHALDVDNKAGTTEKVIKIPAMHSQFSQDFTEENKLLKQDKL